MQGGAEALLQQERRQNLTIRLGDDQFIDRHRQRRIGTQFDKLTRQPRHLGMRDQIVAHLARLHARRCGENSLQIAEFRHQLGRRFRPDARHPRHVVHVVAHQRLRFDHFLRRHPEFLHHLVKADGLHLQRIRHRHAGADQLHQILVGRDDDRLSPRLHRRAGIGGDQIVGFPIGQFDGGHTEGARGLPHQRELRAQFLRRFRALRLVLVVEPIAEGVPSGVENHRQMRAGVFLDQPGEHVGEAEDGIHRRAIRPRHRWQGVEGAEDEPRAVNQNEVHRHVQRPIFNARCRRPPPHAAHTGASNTGR